MLRSFFIKSYDGERMDLTVRRLVRRFFSFLYPKRRMRAFFLMAFAEMLHNRHVSFRRFLLDKRSKIEP